MRAWLLPWWPALNEVYGITPMNFHRYSVAELNRHVEVLIERSRRS